MCDNLNSRCRASAAAVLNRHRRSRLGLRRQWLFCCCGGGTAWHRTGGRSLWGAPFAEDKILSIPGDITGGWVVPGDALMEGLARGPGTLHSRVAGEARETHNALWAHSPLAQQLQKE